VPRWEAVFAPTAPTVPPWHPQMARRERPFVPGLPRLTWPQPALCGRRPTDAHHFRIFLRLGACCDGARAVPLWVRSVSRPLVLLPPAARRLKRQWAANSRSSPTALRLMLPVPVASRWACLRWQPRGLLLVLDRRDDLPNFPHSPAVDGRERHWLLIVQFVLNRSQAGF
jgi:hypothetical protein